jgi:HEAT repeat protein
MIRCRSWLVVVAVVLSTGPARAYVDLAPTLGRIVRDSQTITLAEVEAFSREKSAVILKKVRDLKGDSGAEPIKHVLVRSGEPGLDRVLQEWATPGSRCVLLIAGKTAIVCVGEGWYQAHATGDGWWRIGASRPDLPLAYYGPVAQLADAVVAIVAGKSAVITTLPHGADHIGASFDLALNRASLPGLVKVQRLRASSRMPDVAMGVGANPAFVLGPGRASKEDVPALREKLQCPDADVRARSATDLGSLGAQADTAAGDLATLLGDEVAAVRLAAASALLRIKPDGSSALAILEKGLTSADAPTRRLAARAAGLAGSAAAPLVPKLAALLKDADLLVRRAALQAIGTLGPSAAAAAPAVAELLAQRETAIDAADTLGWIGPASRPALKEIAKLLSAESKGERWAAVRAMAQIGGPDATPAVQFMIRELPGASEIDGYNTLIYLSLLGPVAKDAAPAVRSSRVRNPVLRQTTAWAIDPGADLPWLGPLGGAEFAQYIMEAYVVELGDHLKPVAQNLARKILAGSAGTIPSYGYKLLARFPDEALAILTPGLADKDRTVRQRAVVAVGYMGRAAAAAKPQVEKALKATEDEREERLLKWCLRELGGAPPG